jgi:hypothetical protein
VTSLPVLAAEKLRHFESGTTARAMKASWLTMKLARAMKPESVKP